MRRTDIARTIFGVLFVVAGTMHFVVPASYRAIVPGYLPAPAVLVAVSGFAEMAGGLGLLVPRWRPAAGVGLMALLVAVLPANVEMLRQARAQGVPPPAETLLWVRLPFQAVLVWWAWRLSRPTPARRGA